MIEITSNKEEYAMEEALAVDWFDRYPRRTRVADSTPAPRYGSVAAVAQ
ncbi:hypothetical protein AB0K18_05035 [Nonomuraea sp. NPDC049421]